MESREPAFALAEDLRRVEKEEEELWRWLDGEASPRRRLCEEAKVREQEVIELIQRVIQRLRSSQAQDLRWQGSGLNDAIEPLCEKIIPWHDGGLNVRRAIHARICELLALRVHVRWMIRRDMPEVLEIENQSFEFPWSEEDFIRCLRQRNCIGMVSEFEERIVGFMVYELHKTRLHVLNFAVHPDYRRRGVGAVLMNKLISKLSYERQNRILLEVRETNLPALLFFRNTGFRAISVLRDFYDDTTEDAYLMQHRLPAQAALTSRASLPLADCRDTAA